MISVHSMKRTMIGGQPYDFEFKGLSTDTKPSTWGGNDVGVNSLFFEQDTGDFYYLKQQGSESTQRIDYVNLTVSDWFSTSNYYFPSIPAPVIDPLPETVTAIWDGETYSLTVDEYGNYGAPYNEQDDTYDFADYSFSFFRDEFGYFNLGSKDNNTHTIVVYTEETVVAQAEWAKIGGGSDGELLFEATLTDWEYNGDFEAYVVIQAISELFPSVISVEWDGDVYQLVRHEDAGVYTWGSEDAPLNLLFHNGDLVIISPTDGTHTIKVYG